MATAIDRQIAALRQLTTTKLKERYLQTFGEPTHASHKEYLVRRIAWRLQANAYGGLTKRALRRARQLVDLADLRLKLLQDSLEDQLPSPAPLVAPVAGRPIDRRLPLPGSCIVRHYHGRMFEVKVLADGFVFEGTVYRSLSAVANAITGSHLNGFWFFGLQANGSRHD